MEAKHIAKRRPQQKERQLVPGGSDAGIMVSDCGVAIRLWTGDQTRAQAAKSLTAQAQCLRPVGRKSSRAGHRRWQTAPNLTTFVKLYAILWQKLYARLSGQAFVQGNRMLVSREGTHPDIRDRASMKTGRPSSAARTRGSS